MAVSLYTINENGTFHEIPSIKSCWSQGASELRECRSEDECVVDTRFKLGYWGWGLDNV